MAKFISLVVLIVKNFRALWLNRKNIIAATMDQIEETIAYNEEAKRHYAQLDEIAATGGFIEDDEPVENKVEATETIKAVEFDYSTWLKSKEEREQVEVDASLLIRDYGSSAEDEAHKRSCSSLHEYWMKVCARIEEVNSH